jgi:hypothetical protein
MPTQLELEAMHRQESSDHNAKILETKDTRGLADLVNGKAIKSQIAEAVTELTVTKADLVDGKVPSSQLPNTPEWILATTSTADGITSATISQLNQNSEVMISWENVGPLTYVSQYLIGKQLFRTSSTGANTFYQTGWDDSDENHSPLKTIFTISTKVIQCFHYAGFENAIIYYR